MVFRNRRRRRKPKSRSSRQQFMAKERPVKQLSSENDEPFGEIGLLQQPAKRLNPRIGIRPSTPTAGRR